MSQLDVLNWWDELDFTERQSVVTTFLPGYEFDRAWIYSFCNLNVAAQKAVSRVYYDLHGGARS